jgi:inorganic pyrophosphatase
VTGRIVILNKALDEGKWAKVTGWGGKADAQRILLAAIDRYKAKQAAT